ncbi:MAG: AAA family ATPase [bacterium]|nr:AAA family ATPase [bacterium]
MKVKKIRMVGFKSFADETVIDLESGITCIVGPNGCGKSNILDAVRWVLGEKSAKGLRGKNMEDVIFLGSEHRKQAGMAEVEIYFDNKDRSLKIDQAEVVIGRRIYLQSGSEYYLNGKRSTRRDIEKVFMDTGIGKSAYSIMEQGRISEILKATPESRRGLLDEAAGVSRFKSERKETLDRLHDTEQNLLRLGDILKSKKDEMENLERQARKTRRYIKLKEHLDKHDRNLRFLNYRGLEEKSRKAEEKLAALVKRRDESLESSRQCEARMQEIESENQGFVEEMQRLDRAFHQDLSNLEAMKSGLERIDAERGERTARMSALAARVQEEEKKHQELEKKHQQSRQLELDLQADIESLLKSNESIEAKLKELRASIDSTIEQEEASQKEIHSGEDRQAELLEDLKAVTQDLILELERKKKELESREDYRNNLKSQIVTKLSGGVEILREVETQLRGGGLEASAAADRLQGVQLDAVVEDFRRYESIEQEFRSLLFDKSGLLAKKEQLDKEMDEIARRRDFLQKDIVRLQEVRKSHLAELDKEKNRKVELELQMRDAEVRRESSLEAREGIAAQLKEATERLSYLKEEQTGLKNDLEKFRQEEEGLKADIAAAQIRTKEQSAGIDKIKKQIEKSRAEVGSLREKARREMEKFESALPEISKQERNAEQFRVSISTLEEELYNDFQISLGELKAGSEKLNLNQEREASEYRRINQEIRELGAFNALAIEELERATESHNELEKQRVDIEDAKKNILSILKEIDTQSQTLFRDTFERIQVNFTEIFQTLFGGGRANLSLTEPEDPMNSGVDIMVQPPGKKNSSIALLSGGEQSMTAIALMFAIYLVRPSPFCFLDEIDAPLDDNNVGRFLKMLGRFAPRTQFMVISHNKLTMAKSSGIFGVTQEEAGVSKILSVRLKERESAAV